MSISKKNKKSSNIKPLITPIIKTITSYKKVDKIVLFGSRARGDYAKASDIDLVVFAKDWNLRDLSFIKEELEDNIKTCLFFDVIGYYQINNESLKKQIIQEGKVLYEQGKD